MPPRNAWQRVEKERGGGGAESGCSVWPLQRSEQDVWTLHKHHWSLNPPLPPCQTGPAVLAKTKYMDVCVPVSLSISAHQQTSVYQWEDPAGLVCQCLWTAMFDDVSPCVYINETEMYALICQCARMSAYVYLCVCAHVTGGLGGGERCRVEKLVLLRAAAVWTGAAAKENCGRKSLLIEHEVCHLKLESSETPETTAGRHLSAPILRCRQAPGACLPPTGVLPLAGPLPFACPAAPWDISSR